MMGSMTPAQRRQRQLAPIRTGLYVKAPNGLRLRSRKVRRLVAKMRAEMPWLAPADLPACRAWAELELLGARAFVELEANGVTNAAGEPRRLLGDFRAIRQAQLAFERELGMTPASRMALHVGDSRAKSLVAQCAVETERAASSVKRRAGGGKVLSDGRPAGYAGPPSSPDEGRSRVSVPSADVVTTP
jgi:hypothetical protein